MEPVFFTYDVFTQTVFGGNPLAVFPDGSDIVDAKKQQIAREFNLSETVFIEPAFDHTHAARLRIFTPAKELPFAGHPTIGAALHLAWSGALGTLQDGDVRIFEELAGTVAVRFGVEDGAVKTARLMAPQSPRFIESTHTNDFLSDLTGVPAADIGLADFRPAYVTCGTDYLLLPLANVTALEKFWMRADLYPQAMASAKASGVDLNGLFAFTQHDGHWQARMLWNDMGIAEDPATGSAAVCLAGYLARHASASNGHWQYSLLQGVEMGRPSQLSIEASKEAGVVTRCYVGGSAVLISKGTYLCL
ncbi:PhzF family phenazine biosynthesis protein [Leeia oryzae]|uniref:PhzF family phenazine biosynthesis protein n=1 Tax=Leeia oryzae TaxID=356662 RepID=UPI00036FFD25|nr:PhzF family phenazine biosynthesis protein [Leeia oryzae]